MLADPVCLRARLDADQSWIGVQEGCVPRQMTATSAGPKMSPCR
jgi:hypothetical protein